MAWQDDQYTSPDEIFLQYQSRRYSELNGEVDREAASGTVGSSTSAFSPSGGGISSGGGGTILFNPRCFLGDTVFHLYSKDAPKVIYFEDLFASRAQFIGKDALSFDKHNRIVRGEIIDVFENEADSYLKVYFSDGEVLSVLKEHRFLSERYEYEQIQHLLNKKVFNGDGSVATVEGFEVVTEQVKVYNASIFEYKNYCVGKTKKRCHNLKPSGEPVDQ